MYFIKYIVLALVFILITDTVCIAQKNSKPKYDVVHLKDGTEVSGVIIDVFHDNYVDIVTTENEKIRIIYRDVQRIEYGDEFKGKVKYNKAVKSKITYNIPGKKMYYNIMLDLHMGRGQGTWIEPGRGLSFSTGYRFSKNAIVGVGAGIDTYTFNIRGPIVPVFAEYRYEFMNRSFTPFATMRAGYGIPIGQQRGWNTTTNKEGGLFLNPMAGVRLRTRKKGHFHFALGWKTQQYLEEGIQFNWGPNGQTFESTYIDKITFSRMTINAGLMF